MFMAGIDKLDDDLIEEMKKILEFNYNFSVRNYTDKFFRRRVRVAIKKKNLSLKEYTEQMQRNKLVADVLIKELSINVTQFFRNSSLWEFIQGDLFPQIINKKIKDNETLRIWSAGTATGQEPYSIAISIHKILKSMNKSLDVDISGVDISNKALTYLRKGFYQYYEIEGVSDSILKEYFIHNERNKTYEVIDEIKKMVSVSKMDLFAGEFPKERDIIFCRNVVIYFNRELKDKLYKRFSDSLKIGGYFIMGMSETLPLKYKKTLKLVSLPLRIHVKLPKDAKKKIEIENSNNIEIRNKIMQPKRTSSTYDPFKKEIVDIVSNSINEYLNVKKPVIRGFIGRSVDEWKKQTKKTTEDFLNIPPGEGYNEFKAFFDLIKWKWKRVNPKSEWGSIDHGFENALTTLISFLEVTT